MSAASDIARARKAKGAAPVSRHRPVGCTASCCTDMPTRLARALDALEQIEKLSIPIDREIRRLALKGQGKL